MQQLLPSRASAQPGHPHGTVLRDKVGALCWQDGWRAQAGQWDQEGRTGRCLSALQKDRAAACPWTRFVGHVSTLQVTGQNSDGDRAVDVAPDHTQQSWVPAGVLVFNT